MIQLNLLPELKTKYIKTKRSERAILFVTITTSLIALTILIVTYLAVDVYQKNHLANISDQIKTDSAKITSNADVNKMITIQNRLDSNTALPSLYKDRISPTLIFDYLKKVVTPGITISTITIDYKTGVLGFSGKANSLLEGNVFYNTLLYAKYSPTAASQPTLLFQGTQMTGLNAAPADTGNAKTQDKISYSVTTRIPTNLFINNVDPSTISVPQKDVTRSTLDQPTDIFKK